MLDWLFTNDPGAAARRNAYPTQYREYQGPTQRAPYDPDAAARRNAYPTQYRDYGGSQEQYEDYQEPQVQRAHRQSQAQHHGCGEVHVQRKGKHFFVQAQIADVAFMALIDSGASDCIISHKVMHDLGADLRGIRWDSTYNTANGPARAITLPLDLTVMGIERSGVTCSIMERDFGGGPLANLIGMSFLSTLSSCEQRGNVMILRP